MENVLSYNFGEIEYTVRQEIHTTSARLNAALDDLRAQVAPLQESGPGKPLRRIASSSRAGSRRPLR